LRADNYDAGAADTLLTLWKERTGAAKTAAQVDRSSRKQGAKQASMGSTKSSAPQPRRKVFRRSDIVKLMQTDPDRYMDMQDEIYKAYQEGRVK